jgi:hypothetical protein
LQSPLPPVILLYLAARKRDADLLDLCFTEDAVVIDRGTLYKGRESMIAWQESLAVHYPERRAEVMKVLRAKEADEYSVQVRMTGPFPGGSSMRFLLKFRVREDRIVALEIT